ncbi:hypothetical protein CDAR_183771 [Caerostris darwini]|uniref:Uncharacterized protein n=1 Tax=Caerostris darwini TaxID=1538125 RepID=A0AAV4TXD2_9ARAC|nr:hypothetical protein CDAR_183771 [Caerostris darwini]
MYFGSRSSPETFSYHVSLGKILPKYCLPFAKTNALLSGHLDFFSGRISRIPRRGRVICLPCPALIPQGRSACGQSALGLACPGISLSLAALLNTFSEHLSVNVASNGKENLQSFATFDPSCVLH